RAARQRGDHRRRGDRDMDPAVLPPRRGLAAIGRSSRRSEIGVLFDGRHALLPKISVRLAVVGVFFAEPAMETAVVLLSQVAPVAGGIVAQIKLPPPTRGPIRR